MKPFGWLWVWKITASTVNNSVSNKFSEKAIWQRLHTFLTNIWSWISPHFLAQLVIWAETQHFNHLTTGRRLVAVLKFLWCLSVIWTVWRWSTRWKTWQCDATRWFGINKMIKTIVSHPNLHQHLRFFVSAAVLQLLFALRLIINQQEDLTFPH